MIILPHALVGAAIATKVDNPGIAFLLGFASHFILDAIPHLDPGTITNPFGKKDIPWPKWVYGVVLIDVIITFFVFWIFKNRPDFNLMIWGAVGGISVDVIENFPVKAIYNWPIIKQIQWLHCTVHYWLPTEKWYLGLVSEIIVIGGSLWFLLRF